MTERDRKEEEASPSVAGRKTLGPKPRPGGRYSVAVGVAFLILVLVAFANMITTREAGTLGLDPNQTDTPLPEFAVPLALSSLEGDANIAQDDCETSELPCPSGSERTPACRVDLKGAIRICDLFDKPLVISFWFTKGGDCEAQQDIVNAAYEKFRGRVNFLSLNIRDDRDKVREIVRERGWTMPVGVDQDGAVSNIYRVGLCPTFAFAYPGGLLERAVVGEIDPKDFGNRVRFLIKASARRAAEG